MLFEFSKWMFINLMVVIGLTFMAAYPMASGGSRNPSRYPWREVLAFTGMSVFFLYTALSVGPGQQIDMRMTPMGLAGWMYGWPASLLIGAVTLALRSLKGGPGVYTSAVLTALYVVIFPLFRGRPRTFWWLMLMGAVQAVLLFVVGQTMVHPQPPGLEPTSPFWLIILAAYSLGMVLLNVVVDHVLEKRRLQRELSDELSAKQAVLELIPFGIMMLDKQRRVTHQNQAAASILCCDQIPCRITEHPEVDAALREGRRVQGCRVTCQTKSGHDRIILVSAVPLEHGAILGLENVTNVVNQEREEAQRDRLELLGQLSAMAAHEIKNPLTTIKGFLQLMERRPEFAGHRSSFALLQGEVEHINRVVGDFLVLSGRQSKKPMAVMLDDLLGELLAVMRLQHPGNAVQVVLAGEARMTLQADPQSLKQILKNLVSNAYEAMPDGGTLTIHRGRRGDQAEISVSDTGQGILSDVLPLIFRPYLTTKATGTGLGLAISHKLAADMGGSLEVASETGRGSTFLLRLPVAGQAHSAATLAGLSD